MKEGGPGMDAPARPLSYGVRAAAYLLAWTFGRFVNDVSASTA